MNKILVSILGIAAEGSRLIVHLKPDDDMTLLEILHYLHDNKLQYQQFYGHIFVTEEIYSDMRDFITTINNP